LVLFKHAVFLDLSSIDRDDIQWSSLQRLAEQWDWHQVTSPSQMPERVLDADLVVINPATK
jgi:glycerate dehydrogenase